MPTQDSGKQDARVSQGCQFWTFLFCRATQPNPTQPNLACHRHNPKKASMSIGTAHDRKLDNRRQASRRFQSRWRANNPKQRRRASVRQTTRRWSPTKSVATPVVQMSTQDSEYSELEPREQYMTQENWQRAPRRLSSGRRYFCRTLWRRAAGSHTTLRSLTDAERGDANRPDAGKRFQKCLKGCRDDMRHDAGNSTPSVARWWIVSVSLSQFPSLI